MRILIVGDLHCPAQHPKYLQFCNDLYEEYECDSVIFIGDLIDWQAISFHTKHPELPGPADEYKLAKAEVKKWYKAFPKAKVTIGNHDRRPMRLAETVAVPNFMLRNYSEIWETPGWQWDTEFMLDGVSYYHGEGCGGIHPAYTRARTSSVSVVIGHVHQASGVKWIADANARRFGMDVGTGIDVDKLQFAYGRHFQYRPILSAGIVIDGVPYHEIMPVGPGEKYRKRR